MGIAISRGLALNEKPCINKGILWRWAETHGPGSWVPNCSNTKLLSIQVYPPHHIKNLCTESWSKIVKNYLMCPCTLRLIVLVYRGQPELRVCFWYHGVNMQGVELTRQCSVLVYKCSYLLLESGDDTSISRCLTSSSTCIEWVVVLAVLF